MRDGRFQLKQKKKSVKKRMRNQRVESEVVMRGEFLKVSGDQKMVEGQSGVRVVLKKKETTREEFKKRAHEGQRVELKSQRGQ